jgi:hypothetical protein
VTRSILASLICAAGLAACGGGGASAPAPIPVSPAPSTPAATPTASPTPNSAAPHASVTGVSFSSNATTTFTVTESAYTGAFHESDTCNPLTGEIAAVSSAGAPANGSATYSVTPIGAGTCQITVTDDAAASVTIPVTVSTAALTVQ